MKYVPTPIHASLVLHSKYKTESETTLPLNLESSKTVLQPLFRQHGFFSGR